MLIFQGFANSRIVREFPPFSFKVRIATLTRKGDTHYPSRVRIDAAGSAGTFSPSDTGKVIYDDSFLLYDA